jgi:Ca2+-binding RTX toxin-like protein
VNTTDDRTVTITNTGGTVLRIGAIRFIDPVTGDEIVGGPFSLANPPVGNVTLQPGSSSPLELDINFSPTAGTGETSEAVLVFIERRADGTLGDAIGFVDETGRTVQGIDVSGTGVDQVNPEARSRGCTVIGTRRGEALTGTPGNDVICALAGNDRVRPLGGKDVTRAGSGNDRVIDRSGLRDKLLGNGGRDWLNAKDRNRDLLIGAGGRDTCAKNRGDRVRSCYFPSAPPVVFCKGSRGRKVPAPVLLGSGTVRDRTLRRARPGRPQLGGLSPMCPAARPRGGPARRRGLVCRRGWRTRGWRAGSGG